MASTQLSADTRSKIMKIIPMLGSSNSGEVVAAAAALKRTLEADGKDLIDLSKRLAKKQKEPTPTRSMGDTLWMNNAYRTITLLESRIKTLEARNSELMKQTAGKTIFASVGKAIFWVCILVYILK